MTNYNKSIFQIALLSVSLLTILAGTGVAPDISKIVDAFPLVDETLV